MDLKGTRSEQNVKAAFAGESQARNKYTYFAMQAKEQGHDDIADMFEKMAENEKQHAKIWFNIMNNGLGDVKTNLQEAASGENYEWKSMYPQFAAVAREEGFEQLAIMFDKIAAIENDHERRFLETLINFMKKEREGNAKTAHKELEEIMEVAIQPQKLEHGYRCMFCGDVEESYLDVCPVCEAIGAFERF